MAHLLHELITDAAWRSPAGLALRYAGNSLDYAELARCVDATAQALMALDLQRGERVAVFLDKRDEAVLAMFGAAVAGCAFVPINHLLKAEQVGHILRDSRSRVLVTSPARRALLDPVLARCPELRCVIQTGAEAVERGALPVFGWDACLRSAGLRQAHRVIDSDLAALLYTSGGSPRAKAVVLSHRNLLAGADSLVRCLGLTSRDRVLASLPLCRDDGFSQLTTCFASGALAVLMNPLLTRDIPDMVALERIPGFSAVAPLAIRLGELDWQERHALRYIVSAGAPLPDETIAPLRRHLPRTGELVQRGALVAQGFWNDKAGSSAVSRALQAMPGMPQPEQAMWSGQIVRADADGYLYPLGRSDELIKTSGYSVSPGEIEEVVQATGLVAEVAAVGIAHPVHGQAIALMATPLPGCVLDSAALLAPCRARLPRYMLPCLVELRSDPLSRDAGGKPDRRLLAAQLSCEAMV